MKSFKFFGLLFLALFFISCGGSDSDGGNDNDPMSDDVNPIPKPSAALLIFPEDDTECNTGIVVNEVQSDVTFEWNASQNTDSYEITLINLNTANTQKANSATNEVTVRIERGTPYEWFVVSKATGTSEIATSERWRFYNEGPGVENYAPFPAEAINPQRGANLDAATTIVTLEWSSSDVDSDIVEHEVFFGPDAENLESLGRTVQTRFENVTVLSSTTYFWQVVTYDEKQNSSISEMFQFRVN